HLGQLRRVASLGHRPLRPPPRPPPPHLLRQGRPLRSHARADRRRLASRPRPAPPPLRLRHPARPREPHRRPTLRRRPPRLANRRRPRRLPPAHPLHRQTLSPAHGSARHGEGHPPHVRH